MNTNVHLRFFSILSSSVSLHVMEQSTFYRTLSLLDTHTQSIRFPSCVPSCPCYLLSQQQMADANNDNPVTETSEWMSSIWTANISSFQPMGGHTGDGVSEGLTVY